jgi:hypothetical protein
MRSIQLDRLLSIGGLGDHLEIGLGAEDRLEPRADEWMIVS